jgi:hypothetical protein
MVDATISRARLRGLARLGRARGRCAAAEGVAAPPPHASRRQAATDAASIGDVLPPRPRAASPRPGADDLMASTI